LSTTDSAPRPNEDVFSRDNPLNIPRISRQVICLLRYFLSTKGAELSEKNISRPHVSNDNSSPSVEKAGLLEDGLDKEQRWRENESYEIPSFTGFLRCICRQAGIAIDPIDMLLPGAIWKMEKITAEHTD
jgi:hypothetical protein